MKPAERFRFVDSTHTKRRSQCRSCHAAEKREGWRRRRDKEIQVFNREIYRSRDDVGRVVALVNQLITRFGGIEGFARTWKETLDRASKQGRDGVALRAMSTLIITTAAAQKLRPDPPVAELSDEELAREQAREIGRLLVQEPHVAAEVLRGLGWKVEPPIEKVQHPKETNR